MLQLTVEQNHRHMQLEKWEHELYEREMDIIERELKLLMSASNQERLNQQTPKIQKRSGRFMRSLLHGALSGNMNSLSAAATNLISGPTSLLDFRKLIFYLYNVFKDFRHLISVHRENDSLIRHCPALDYDSSSTISNVSVSPPSQISYSKSNTLPIQSKTRTTPKAHSLQSNNFLTSNSTPTTPSLSRFRTLICEYFSYFFFNIL